MHKDQNNTWIIYEHHLESSLVVRGPTSPDLDLLRLSWALLSAKKKNKNLYKLYKLYSIIYFSEELKKKCVQIKKKIK